jgi:hypothetical protein
MTPRAAARRRCPGDGRSLRDRLGDREGDDECGALAGERLDADRATVGLDESLGDREAEARTAMVLTGAAMERLEDAFLLGRGNPWAAARP